MNLKTWVPMGAAIVLGLFAAKLGKDMISKRPAEKTAVSKYAQVVVAKEGIAPGTQLKPMDLVVAQYPENGAPAGSFKSIDDVVGRVITAPLVKQQPVLEGTMAPVGAAAGLPAIVPDGMRAVTIEVNETSGVAGMLVPGCRVDIITVLAADQANPATAKTVVPNLMIIAIGRRFGTSGPSTELEGPPARSVTLLATPKQAEMVDLVCRFGNPRLVLRGSRESHLEKDVDAEGTTLAELRGSLGIKQTGFANGYPTTQPSGGLVAATTQPSRPERPYREVQFIRGGMAQTTKIDVDDNVVVTPGSPDSAPHAPTRQAPTGKAPVVDMRSELAPVPGGRE